VIAAFEEADRKIKRGCPEIVSNRNLKKPYTLNL
tara:strand:+ start:428 stop:529 length:102 start_codon:yes stop_codon:yes gene_type:complete